MKLVNKLEESIKSNSEFLEKLNYEEDALDLAIEGLLEFSDFPAHKLAESEYGNGIRELYAKEFIGCIGRKYLEDKMSYSEIAGELGIDPMMVYHVVEQYDKSKMHSPIHSMGAFNF